MPSSRPVATIAAVVLALGLAGCGDGDDGADAEPPATTATTGTPPTTGPSTTEPSTTGPGSGGGPSTTATSPTPAGSTTPTSAPAPAATEGVTLLEAVRVAGQGAGDRVVFELRDGRVPGYDVAYVEPPVRRAGSGEPVAVAGSAVLAVRLAPASGVDLSDGFEEVYTGPDRLTGDTSTVTEVVRTGDFEANLEWAIGVEREVPFRVSVLADPARVVIDLGPPAG